MAYDPDYAPSYPDVHRGLSRWDRQAWGRKDLAERAAVIPAETFRLPPFRLPPGDPRVDACVLERSKRRHKKKQLDRDRKGEPFRRSPEQRARRRAAERRKRERVFKRDSYRCVKCGATEDLTIDHIIPLSKGGPKRKLSNLQTLCAPCNNAKGSSTNP